jgi:hypothetical protein
MDTILEAVDTLPYQTQGNKRIRPMKTTNGDATVTSTVELSTEVTADEGPSQLKCPRNKLETDKYFFLSQLIFFERNFFNNVRSLLFSHK